MNINDPAFADAVADAFIQLWSERVEQQEMSGRDASRHPLGQRANRDLAERHAPTNADVHCIAVFAVDEVDRRVNVPGAKGIGEIGIVGVAAAIANAVFNATGVRIRDLPITLDKVLAGLERTGR